MRPLLEYFSYAHLPPYLQEVSKPFYDLARTLSRESVALGYDEREISVALRKLLEAKDAAVRAAVRPAVSEED